MESFWVERNFHFFFGSGKVLILYRSDKSFFVIVIVDLGAPNVVTFFPPSGPAARKDRGERML